jgi:UDP-N-acetyl-D-glucosamine dehydrogenase
MRQIAVVGLGYVGLPLAIGAASKGYKVIGIDVNSKLLSDLSSDFVTSSNESPNLSTKLNSTLQIEFTSDFGKIKEVEVVLVCVPTPLDKSRNPDLGYVISALKSIAPNLSPQTLVILESTVAPGTTRNIVTPILQEYSTLKANDIHVAFSPERTDPNNPTWDLANTPKLVAGLSDKATQLAIDFYSKFVTTIVRCNSVEVAETAKLLENSYRLVNISLINEISAFCHEIGVDVLEVIKAASTKPYGYAPFYPGVGAGGHCIPVDPVYLLSKAKELGVTLKSIQSATEINSRIPTYYVERATKILGKLEAKRILIIGVSYKKNISDTRETPVAELIQLLSEKGAEVEWHDEFVREWNHSKSVPLSSNYDLAILATPHDGLDLSKVGNVQILDTRSSV